MGGDMRKPKRVQKLEPGTYTGIITAVSMNPSSTRMRMEIMIEGKGRIKSTMRVKPEVK